MGEGVFPPPFVFKRVAPSLRSSQIFLGVFQCKKHVIGGGGREGEEGVNSSSPKLALADTHLSCLSHPAAAPSGHMTERRPDTQPCVRGRHLTLCSSHPWKAPFTQLLAILLGLLTLCFFPQKLGGREERICFIPAQSGKIFHALGFLWDRETVTARALLQTEYQYFQVLSPAGLIQTVSYNEINSKATAVLVAR